MLDRSRFLRWVFSLMVLGSSTCSMRMASCCNTTALSSSKSLLVNATGRKTRRRKRLLLLLQPSQPLAGGGSTGSFLLRAKRNQNRVWSDRKTFGQRLRSLRLHPRPMHLSRNHVLRNQKQKWVQRGTHAPTWQKQSGQFPVTWCLVLQRMS